jgi:mannose-6-phosphate isomerase
MYDYGRGRELHIEKSLEATRLVTRAGKVAPKVLADRTILIDVEYFRVEMLTVDGSRSSATLPGADETGPGLAYLFAAAGSARLNAAGFDAVELPERGVVAVPASAPEFVLEDLGGLDLVRIVPRWPQETA